MQHYKCLPTCLSNVSFPFSGLQFVQVNASLEPNPPKRRDKNPEDHTFKQLSPLKLTYKGALIRSGLGDEKKIPCHFQESNVNRPTCKGKR